MPPTMLIVEDEPLIRMCAVDFAEEAGFRAHEAKDAAQAMAVLEAQAIDILFTDITLPGPMDGLELADRVAERWPAIRIIVASGALGGLGPEIAPGAKRLAKPYGFRQFMDALEQREIPAASAP